jgi:putative transcriptional regulator
MAIVVLREFPIPVRAQYLCRAINGEVIMGTTAAKVEREVTGYTVVDTRRAVEALSGTEYTQLLGGSTERALIFTNVENTALAMMIVHVSNLKPRLVVFHKVKPDEETIKLAENEQIPLIYSAAPTVEQLVKALRKLYRLALRIKLGRRVKPPPKISA